MPIRIQGLKGLSDLSNIDYELWRKELEKLGKLTSSSSIEQQDRLYRNQLFIKRFGLDNFNKLDYQLRDELYKADIVQNALNKKYGKDPIYGRLSTLSTDNKLRLLESDYQSDLELDNYLNKQLKSLNLKPKKDTSFEGILKDMLLPYQQLAIENYKLKDAIKDDVKIKKKHNNAFLEELEKEDNDLKENEVSDYSNEIFNLLLSDLNSHKIGGLNISDLFDIIGLYSNYYKAFQKSDKFDNLTTTDKMNYLAKFKALKDTYGEYKAAMWLDLKMRDFVSENQSGWEWAGNTGKNIVLGGVAHLADGVMGTRALFMSEKERAMFLQGKDINGNDLPDWLNPLYWQGVDLFNTFDANEINRARANGGISLYLNITKTGEDLDFFSWNTVNEVAKQTKYLWSDYLVGRLTGGVGSLLSKVTKGVKWLNKATDFTSALGTVAYSGVANAEAEGLNAFQETLQGALEQRDALIDKEVNEEVSQRLKTKEALKYIDDYVNKERQKLKSKTKENQSYIFDEKMWRQRGEDLYRQILTDELKEKYEKLHEVDTEAAEKAANSAYVTTATIDELRAGVGNFLFKKFLYSKGTRKALGDNGPKMDITSSTEGTLSGKMGVWNKWIKPMGAAPLGEGLEEVGDNMVSNLGQGLGLKLYMDYNNKMYNPENYVLVTDNFLSHFLGGTDKAIDALSEKGTWYEGFIGALSGGTNVSPSLRFMTDKTTKEDRKDWTISEKINRYITNPIIHDLAEARQVERSTKQQIDAANKVLSKNKDTLLSISEMITSIKNRADANNEDLLKGADEKQTLAFTLMTTLNALGNSEIASQSSLYQNAIKAINDAAQGNISEDIITTYLGLNSNRTAESVEEAKLLLLQNALTLLDMQNSINEAYDLFDKSALTNFQDNLTAFKARNEIAYLYVMKQNWLKRLDEINRDNLGVGTPLIKSKGVKFLTKRAWETLTKAQGKLVDKILKNLEEVEKKIQEEEEKDTNELDAAKLRALNLNKRKIEERLNREKLELETLNNYNEEFKDKDLLDTVLSEEDILALNAIDRATILDPKNLNNYTKEQLKIIKETIKNLVNKDPSLITLIFDAAILQNRILDSEDAIFTMMEHPIETMEYVNGLELERREKVENLFKEQARNERFLLFDNASDEELSLIALGTSTDLIDDYILERPERKSTLELIRPVVLFREDAAALIAEMETPDDYKDVFRESIINITQDARTVEQAIDNLEAAIDSKDVDLSTKFGLKTLLKKLQDTSYQRTATKVHDEREKKRKKEKEEKERKEEEERRRKEPDLFEQQLKQLTSINEIPEVPLDNLEQEKLAKEQLKNQELKTQVEEKTLEKVSAIEEQELLEEQIEINGSTAVISPTAQQEVLKDITGKVSVADNIITDPNPIEEVSDNPNSETLKGNLCYGYNGEELRKNGKQVPNRGLNENDTINTVMNWLDSMGIKLLDIIDSELNDIVLAFKEVGKTPKIQFMLVNQNEMENPDLADVLGNVIFNVIEYTDEVKRIHNDNLGGVITALDGRKFLIVGTLGYKGPVLQKNFNSIRDRMKRDRFKSGNVAKRFYVNSNIYTEISLIGRGWFVKERLNDNGVVWRSINDLLNDVNRNPEGLTYEDLKWGVRMYSQFATVNVSSWNLVSEVTNNSTNAGNVFLLIKAANGKYIPAKILPTTLEELNDGEIKKQILYLLNNKLLSQDFKERKDAISRLCRILYFNENTNILIGTEKIPTVTIILNGVELAKFNVASPTFNRQEFFNALRQVRFIINITPTTLTSPKFIKQLDEAGCLKTDIALLYLSNADYSVYPVGNNGKPIINELQPLKVPYPSNMSNSDLLKKLPSVRYNGVLYRMKNGSWFGFEDGKEQEINNPNVIALLIYNYRIDFGKPELYGTVTATSRIYILNTDPMNPEVVIRNEKTHHVEILSREKALEEIRKERERIEKMKREQAAKELVELDNLKGETKNTTVEESLEEVDISNMLENQTINQQLSSTIELLEELLEKQLINQEEELDINKTGNKSLDELREGSRGTSALEIMLNDLSVLFEIQEKFKELSNEEDLQKIVDYLASKGIPIIGILNKETFLNNIRNCK